MAMTGDDWVQIIWFVMAFTLVISAIAVRRIPAGTMVKMLAAWALIIGAVFLLVTAWQSL
jgi:hypothetical protein